MIDIPMTVYRWMLSAFLLAFLHPNFAAEIPSIETFTEDMERFEGYFPFYWDEEKGKIWLEVIREGEEFLYVNSLSAGVGSNDIGLDRGQLGQERVVKFHRIGPKVLLVQPNYDYRANSDNPAEVRAVEEAFAQSILAGFKVAAQTDGRFLIDLTDMLLSDAHGVSRSLQRNGQGSYRLDKNRSAVYLPRSKNFPQNTELEAMLTFSGNPTGGYIRSVTPTPQAVTVRMHHSFIQLPDDQYIPRVFDPRAGYFPFSYADYATPIDQPVQKRFITRHRLQKKDPNAASSEAVEPIVYYVDPGAPEPIRSALIEGASWWNQAFEAAGYKDAFRVEVLPEGADPLDVRYNVIQWVHRSTRGWSYGASVVDPRTGEIIKGHVSLGSLRVRQDFLITQGLIQAYKDGEKPDPMLEKVALARLRQLSAHEVGHTLGLAHNYIASSIDRASVMDYPHPYFGFKLGKLNTENAYDVGIGEWDKRSIIYGYQDFPQNKDVATGLSEILEESEKIGQVFLSDAEARPQGSSHPETHLWDNGEDAADELERLIDLRKDALNDFSEKNIPVGTPLAMMEDVLVPIYFMHRYQVEAAAKVIGGRRYRYQVRGDNQPDPEVVSATEQKKAMEALLKTLDPGFLTLPAELVDMIPPRPLGYSRGREHFKIKTGFTLDPLGIAETSADMTLKMLLHPERANRMVAFHAYNDNDWGLHQMLDVLTARIFGEVSERDRILQSSEEAAVRRVVQKALVKHLIHLALDPRSQGQTKALANRSLNRLYVTLFPDNLQLQGKNNVASQLEIRQNFRAGDQLQEAHETYCREMINRYFTQPELIKLPPTPSPPDGSPIGSCSMYGE
ncbi:MAG: zinc-dependent metalloprotease [Bacteroidota bacterium]